MSGSTDDPVLLEVRDDGVARLTLNRPDAANAINLELADALADATSQLAALPALRVVLLTGAGKRFCAGGDVRAFAAAGEDLGEALAEILGALHLAVESLAELDAPVVAAVQGNAAGAGLSLVAGADLVLAGEDTRFVLAYTGIGLIPDAGSTWYLPRLVGHRRASELAFTNRVLDAHEALAWGLITRVVADRDLLSEAEQLVAKLAAGPRGAFGATKRLLRESWSVSLADQLGREAAAIVLAGESADGQEGVAAFVEKRPPAFGLD
jgi:2-(1,2-epoxy-1,2-dihydrophenyl)acetyl-CoA isomerase